MNQCRQYFRMIIFHFHFYFFLVLYYVRSVCVVHSCVVYTLVCNKDFWNKLMCTLLYIRIKKGHNCKKSWKGSKWLWHERTPHRNRMWHFKSHNSWWNFWNFSGIFLLLFLCVKMSAYKFSVISSDLYITIILTWSFYKIEWEIFIARILCSGFCFTLWL